MGLKIASIETTLHLVGKPPVEAKDDKNGVKIQEIEDSDPGPQEKGKDIPTNEIEVVGTILLYVFGCLNGISVKILIDSGASECCVDIAFAEKNGLKLTKTKEKSKLHLAHGTVHVSSWVVKQGCVIMGDHAEFLDFSVLKLPTYDAILGKAWLDRWNLVIDWKKHTMEWKARSRLVSMIGEQNPTGSEIVSSIFQNQCIVFQISAQRMRKLSKTKLVFLAVVRETNEETKNESTVTINEDKMKTSYSVEVQAILDEFADVFPKDLPSGLPPSCELNHRI